MSDCPVCGVRLENRVLGLLGRFRREHNGSRKIPVKVRTPQSNPGTFAFIFDESCELSRALAALHRVGVIHGAVGPRQIRLSSADLNETTHAWLGGIVTGHLQQATGGRLIFPDQGKYQRGLPAGVPVFSKPADVHQFLMMMVEARLGGTSFENSQTLQALAQRLTTPRWLCRGISMAAAKEKHWPDGERLQQEVTRSPQWQRWTSIGSAAALLISVFCLGFLWQNAKSEVEAWQAQVAAVRTEKNELQAELSQSQQQARTLEADLTVLRAKSPGPTTTGPISTGEPKPPGGGHGGIELPVLDSQSFWKRHLAGGPRAEGALISLDDFQRLSNQNQNDVKQWNQHWSDLCEAQRILKIDLKNAIEEYGHAPWTPKAFDLVIQRFWQSIIGPDVSVRAISDRVKDLPRHNAVREKLQEWHAQATMPPVTEIDRRWPENKEIRGELTNVRREPWNDHARNSLLARDRQLLKTHELWRTMVAKATAGKPTSWEHFRQQMKDAVELSENSDIKDRLLKQLLTLEQTQAWNMQWTDGATSPGHGRYRLLYFGQPNHRRYGGGKPVDETWGSDTQRQLKTRSSFSLEWNPGQAIQWVLYTEPSIYRGGVRPCLLDETLTGPLVLWTLLVEQNGQGINDDFRCLLLGSDMVGQRSIERPFDDVQTSTDLMPFQSADFQRGQAGQFRQPRFSQDLAAT